VNGKAWLSLILFLGVTAHAGACEGGCDGTSCGSASQPLKAASGTVLDPAFVAEPVVSTPTLVALLTAGTPLVLIDCRNTSCPGGPRIPGSRVVNTDSIPEHIETLFPARDAMMILYDGCSCGVRGVLRAALSKNGYTRIIDYPAGISGWVAAGRMTVETASDSFLVVQPAN